MLEFHEHYCRNIQVFSWTFCRTFDTTLPCSWMLVKNMDSCTRLQLNIGQYSYPCPAQYRLYSWTLKCPSRNWKTCGSRNRRNSLQTSWRTHQLRVLTPLNCKRHEDKIHCKMYGSQKNEPWLFSHQLERCHKDKSQFRSMSLSLVGQTTGFKGRLKELSQE